MRQYLTFLPILLVTIPLTATAQTGDTSTPQDGRLIMTARAGLGPTFPHTESNVEGQQQEQYELGRIAWQAAGGAELKLWKRLYGFGEYKFTRTNQRGKIDSGTAQSLLRTHHGVFGLSYHF